MRYGRDYRRYDRDAYGSRGGYPSRGDRFRGDWPGGGEIYFDEPRRPWSPAYEGYGYPRSAPASGYDSYYGYGPRGGSPGGRETGTSRDGGDADSVCAGDIMTANPEAVTPDTPLAEVAKRMRDLDVGIIPVVDDADTFLLQGVITDRDIAVRAAAEGVDMKKARVRDYMTEEVESVGESDHVRDVFTVMKRDRVRRVPVTDDEGRLVGIVSQADLAVGYAGLDLEREREVEEVIERISEPARARRSAPGMVAAHRRAGGRPARRPGYDRAPTDYLREGWEVLRREAREVMGFGYDRGWW